ncbi:MAG: nitroreductase family protein [Acidimicrobiales bacterium]
MSDLDVVRSVLRRQRAHREFTDDPVDDATLTELLELAARAERPGTMQPWQFVVICAIPIAAPPCGRRPPCCGSRGRRGGGSFPPRPGFYREVATMTGSSRGRTEVDRGVRRHHRRSTGRPRHRRCGRPCRTCFS